MILYVVNKGLKNPLFNYKNNFEIKDYSYFYYMEDSKNYINVYLVFQR